VSPPRLSGVSPSASGLVSHFFLRFLQDKNGRTTQKHLEQVRSLPAQDRQDVEVDKPHIVPGQFVYALLLDCFN